MEKIIVKGSRGLDCRAPGEVCEAELYGYLERVLEQGPIVQCITNFVTVNDCANIILAAGGSPTMAQSAYDAGEVVERADALVCNLGGLEKVEAMTAAGRRANEIGKPTVLDPIGAGGSAKRREIIAGLLSQVRFDVIRGNASEVKALVTGYGSLGGSVDALASDKVTEANLDEAAAMIKRYAQRLGSITVISGEIDIVSDGESVVVIRNGCKTMSRITGAGCMLTSLIGAFCGATPEALFTATCAAVVTMGIAGELADERRLANGTGNATFRNDLIDAVFNLDEKQFKERVRYEIFKG